MRQNSIKATRLICIALVLCILLAGTATGLASALPDVIPIPTSAPFPPEDFPLKEYYTEIIVLDFSPNSEIDDWSPGKLFGLVDLMEMNQRELDQEKLALVRNTNLSDDKRKDIALDMLYQYCKMNRSNGDMRPYDILVVDWGENTTWTLGMRAWRADVAIDHELGNPVSHRNILPGGEDISEEAVIRLAYAHMIELFGLSYEDILAMEQYRTFVYESIPRKSEETTKTWTCRFASAKYDYMVMLTHEGKYLDAAKFDK